MEKKLVSRRNNILTAVAMLALALVVALAAFMQPAFADESSSSAAASDSAASAEIGKQTDIDLLFGGLPMMGNDYVWFGRDLELSGTTVDNDLIAAGQIVNVSKVAAEGSFRMAAQEIHVKDSTAKENMTLAAETVIVKDSQAKAVAAAGKGVSFSGTCDSLIAYAENIYIDGTVNGDVIVGANNVEIGPNAHIKGTLDVTSTSEPAIPSGAEVGKVNYTHAEDNSYSSADIESTLAGFSSFIIVFLIVMSILGTFVVAILSEWLFPRQTAGAAQMIRTRTGATIGTGIVSALVAPIAIIILICLGVTLPVAGGVAFALFAMTAVACGFAGASLFKLVFKNMGRFKCAMLGGLIMGVASAIPFLGSLVSAAAFMYMLGYVLQSIFLGMRNPDPTPIPSAPTPAPVAPVTAAAPVASNVPTAPIPPANPE